MITRRKFFPIAAAPFLPLFARPSKNSNIYQINKLLDFMKTEPPQHIEDISDLGKRFLLQGAKRVTGVYSASNPFAQPQSITDPTKYASQKLISNLDLVDSWRSTSNLTTLHPEDDIILMGGPVPNPYSRLILGVGRGSPILGLASRDIVQLPFTFDLVTPLREGRFRQHSIGAGKSPDWDLIVNGSRIREPGEYLLITSIPNVYAEKGRIVIISGKGGPGTRAIDLVLRNRSLIEKLLKETKGFDGWQILIAVPSQEKEIPLELGTEDVQRIHFDFDKLRKEVAGSPLFSDPREEITSAYLGLLARQDVAKIQQLLTITKEWEPSFPEDMAVPERALLGSPVSGAHSAPNKRELAMSENAKSPTDDQKDSEVSKRLPSFAEIDQYLASIKGKEKQAITAEHERIRSLWANHPLAEILEISGLDIDT
jgi:hypothetical protein